MAIPKSLGDASVLPDKSIRYEATELLHDPRRGFSYRQRIFAPLNQPALINVMRIIQARGGSGKFEAHGTDPYYEYEMPGLPAELAGRIPELFFDTWDLVANESTESIFALPGLDLSENDKIVLSRYQRDGGTIPEAVASASTDFRTVLTAPTSGVAFQIQRELLKGQTEYEKPTHVLIHNSVCSPNSFYNVARANPLSIYSPTAFFNEVRHGWTYNLPNRLYSEIAAIPSQSAPGVESGYYSWGWLKKLTRSSTQTNFTIDVSTEYILGLWSTIRYPYIA